MQSSAAEIKIHHILEEAGINFIEEYTFPDLKAENGKYLRFDYAVFDDDGELLCLIEYNGRQHYVAIGKFGGQVGLYRQRHNDAAKRRYCLEHDLRLETIPFTDEEVLSYDYLMKRIYELD